MDDTNKKIVTGCLILLSTAAVIAMLSYMRMILTPLAIALMFCIILSTLTHWFISTLKFPRLLAVILTMLIFLFFTWLTFVFFFMSLQQLLEGFNSYISKLIKLVNPSLISYLNSIHIHIHNDTLMKKLNELPFLNIAQHISGGVFSIIDRSMLIVMMVLFFIAGDNVQERKNALLTRIYSKISRYVTIKCITSIALGIVVGLVLSLYGVEFAVMFGILTALLNFIPTLGAIIAVALPLPVIMVQYKFDWHFAAILIITVALHIINGSIVETKVFGNQFKLHPIVVIFFLMFWGFVWGIPGLFLAVPITAILKFILFRIETTRPFANLLEGNLPGSSSE